MFTGKSRTHIRRGIAVGGIRGGSGKTLVTVGLIQALRNRGMKVAPFKKGPDYIDTAWLSRASGEHTYNLDTFLMEPERVREMYQQRNSTCDIAVIEGNRGIFDGFDVSGTHSFAEMVKLLKIPLILVVDCTKSSRTVAALVQGCLNFDSGIDFGGIVLNQIAGTRHRSIITGSIEKYTSIPVIGAIPRISGISMRERHLGLIPVHEHADTDETIGMLAKVFEDNVDMERVLQISQPREKHFKALRDRIRTVKISGPCVSDVNDVTDLKVDNESPVVGIFMDPAFNFYYRENIDSLVKNGATVREINAMEEKTLPDIDALYIGGGFPETHATMLSRNREFISSLRERIEKGMPVYAECGGLVYLSDSLTLKEEKYKLAGIFPFEFELADTPQGHGYTIFTVDSENPFYKTGIEVRGHEFRYSRMINPDAFSATDTVFAMNRGTGIAQNRDGVIYKNVLATFIHTHSESRNVEWTGALVRLADKWRKENG